MADPNRMTGEPGYVGPPRDPGAVIRAALANPELQRQLRGALEEERLGILPVPLRQIREELARKRRSA